MRLTQKFREQFTLPTIAETLALAPPQIDGSEDARLMNSYPRLALGTVEDSHDISDATGLYVRGNRCEMSAFIPRNHCLVVGQTGAGKTTLLLKLIEQLSRNTDWYIWIADLKGDPD